ncbi:MAG: hypothetical protein B6242_10090 [Anaerolineaceae bacterium 4572_78]|nr:MAG: hypothetical protein B6242_10090 [Anaerolineaceae bacterium 4572_78]
MEKRIIEFVAGLRTAGVRISIAESEDAFRAILCVGMYDKHDFREALLTSLIKRHRDEPIFDELFPVYFERDMPQMINLMERLTPAEQRLLRRAVRELLGQMENRNNTQMHDQQFYGMKTRSAAAQHLPSMLQSLLMGKEIDLTSSNMLAEQLKKSSDNFADRDKRWLLERRVMQGMGSKLLPQIQEPLPHVLKRMGMGHNAIKKLMEDMQKNVQILGEQASQKIELGGAQQWAKHHAQRRHQAEKLMSRTLQNLNERETKQLQREIRRLVAQLRSRISLRQKRSTKRKLDIRKTLRHNMRYGGIPLELKFQTRSLKPRLLLLCDISNSMRKVVTFALRLVYELQDQVSSVRTFTYIDTIEEISQRFAELPSEEALLKVTARMDRRNANTDLGKCLDLLLQHYPDVIDPRTTVIIIGDACNSWNDPRADLVARMQQRSKEIIWFNPRDVQLWETNDCDMLKYVPHVQLVHRVSTMTELTEAVDTLFD